MKSHSKNSINYCRFILCSFIIFLGGVSEIVFAQGCSDAGICSAGHINAGAAADSSSKSISFSNTFGLADDRGAFTFIQTSQVEAKYALKKNNIFSAKLPYQLASGELGTTSGIGDITVSYTRLFSVAETSIIAITVGGLLPGNNADLRIQDRGLPMVYQSSLGSYDLLVGGSLLVNDWRFAMGYQHPFNKNENSFNPAEWENVRDVSAFFESNQFRRGDDFIIRVEKSFKLTNSVIHAGILPIFRLQEDEIIKNESVVKLEDSKGLTLNLSFTWEKSLSDKWKFKLIYGNPVVWRKTRADGLTRIAVVTTTLSLLL